MAYGSVNVPCVSGAEFTAHADDKTNPHAVTKAQVGLGNVDNTSDADKPVSNATQTALNGKADKLGNSVICVSGELQYATDVYRHLFVGTVYPDEYGLLEEKGYVPGRSLLIGAPFAYNGVEPPISVKPSKYAMQSSISIGGKSLAFRPDINFPRSANYMKWSITAGKDNVISSENCTVFGNGNLCFSPDSLMVGMNNFLHCSGGGEVIKPVSVSAEYYSDNDTYMGAATFQFDDKASQALNNINEQHHWIGAVLPPHDIIESRISNIMVNEKFVNDGSEESHIDICVYSFDIANKTMTVKMHKVPSNYHVDRSIYALQRISAFHALSIETSHSDYDSTAAFVAGCKNIVGRKNCACLGEGCILPSHNNYLVVMGSYNSIDSLDASTRFVIGKGYTSSRANCFRVTNTGVYASGNYNASGADYAELFEWQDGNPDNEDRIGRFVILEGEKIRLAQDNDDGFILGIISGNPAIIGDVYDDQWRGMYLYDIYGRPLWEDVEVPDRYEEMETVNEDGETVTERILIESA